MSCPLCLQIQTYDEVKGADSRRYFHCQACDLIFVDPAQHLSLEAERHYYASTHQNSIEHAGYVSFLNRILEPMLPYLHPGMQGLDYGCGPGPTLSQLLRRQGIACADYDPIFVPEPLDPPYDFIFATECFEHFYWPHQEIGRICALLKPGGLLGVMTEQWTSLAQFSRWYYTTDPTHTSYFHAHSFDYLCREFGLELLWQANQRLFILRRQA